MNVMNIHDLFDIERSNQGFLKRFCGINLELFNCHIYALLGTPDFNVSVTGISHFSKFTFLAWRVLSLRLDVISP